MAPNMGGYGRRASGAVLAMMKVLPEHPEPKDTERGRAIVHIGIAKTGTTSFQAWARRYRRELAAKTGLNYYDGRFMNSHYELAILSIRRDRDMQIRRWHPDWWREEWQIDVRDHIRRQVERPVETLLCSAEGLSLVRDTDEVHRLVQLLRPREVSVVVVLREPAAFLGALADELHRAGLEPNADPESIAYIEPDSWLVRYDDLLDVYRTVLGPDRVTVLSYEENVQRDGSIIPALLRACGADTAELPPWDGLWMIKSGINKAETKRMNRWWRDQRDRCA